MSQKKPILSRRNFLLTVGAGGAASAAAMVAKTPQGISREKSQDKRATQGYQETAHVTNYYRTTKV
jgi:hypothetical protein